MEDDDPSLMQGRRRYIDHNSLEATAEEMLLMKVLEAADNRGPTKEEKASAEFAALQDSQEREAAGAELEELRRALGTRVQRTGAARHGAGNVPGPPTAAGGAPPDLDQRVD